MLFCQSSRTQILDLLPRDAEVAEIGVAQGDFSAEILAHAHPRRLHLIDSWSYLDDDTYKTDINNVANSEQAARYQSVCERFAAEIARGQVQIHRALSTDACHRFEDGQLDWIYLDANHSQQAVRQDLALFAPKIKPSGYLLGHDYANHPWALQQNFGVIEAVDEFVTQRGWTFIALTNEDFPTYVLARADQLESSAELSAKLALGLPGTIDVPDFPETQKFQQQPEVVDGTLRIRNMIWRLG